MFMSKLDITEEELEKLLQKYSSANAISGYEDEVRDLLIEDLRDVSDRVWTDSLGNLIAVRRGYSGKKFMVAAHMDEIGLMVRHIDKNGFIYFATIGGWNDRILPAMRVRVRTRNGSWIPGVIGVKPPHLMEEEERKKVLEAKNLYIDIGAESREEVLKMGVETGSPIVADAPFTRLGGHRVSGKAFDDRAGLVVALASYRAANVSEIDFYFVATVQEEVGLKGARTSSFSISPDIALAVDVTTANDVPQVEEQDMVVKLGKGPAIKIVDGRSGSGLITNPGLLRKLKETAETEGIPYQAEVLPGGTTDASVIQLSREGVPSGAVSVPTRYIHSPVEVLDLRDLYNSVRLITAFYHRMEPKWIDELRERILK
jgi:putative aminopeptidase FrvX